MNKIIKFFNWISQFLTYKFIWLSSNFYTIKDKPGEQMGEYNRKWVYAPDIMLYINKEEWYGFGCVFGWSLYMIQFKGKQVNPPRLCTGYSIDIRPLNWSFKNDHTYYDGPHC